MKLNWGTGIAIFYSCFVLAMIFMVIKSSQNQSHLVQEHYYQKDLNYESFRQKRQNATNMSEQVEIKFAGSQKLIHITFPEQMSEATGKVSLYRPSNKYLDKTFDLKLNEQSSMSIPVSKEMARGLWKVKVDWNSKGQQYYSEENLVL